MQASMLTAFAVAFAAPGAPSMVTAPADAAIALQPLEALRRGRVLRPWAWIFSIAVHAALLASLAHLERVAREIDPPVRAILVTVVGAPAAPGAPPAAAPEPAVAPPPPVAAPPPAVAAPPPPRIAARPAPRVRAVQPPAPAPAPARPETAQAPVAPEGPLAGSGTGRAANATAPAGAAGSGGFGAGTVPAGSVASPPVVLSRVTPEYPLAARHRGLEGTVLMEAILGRDGRLEPEIRVVESLGVLDDPAVAAVRRWRFRPARDEVGRPVRVILRIPVRFVLR